MDENDEKKPIDEQEQPDDQTPDNHEETPENALNGLIIEIKTDYEKRIAEMNAKHEQQIKERDSVIKQLLKGEQHANRPTIAERINATRNFKKW